VGRETVRGICPCGNVLHASKLVKKQASHLHQKEDSDVGLVCETTNNSETADTEVKQLNAEVRQQETRPNLSSR